MEDIEKLFRNIDEKLACACLINKNMRKVVINYICQSRTWLSQFEVEKQADVLLKQSYEKYKRSRRTSLDVIKAFRKAERSQAESDNKCKINSAAVKMVNSKVRDQTIGVEDSKCCKSSTPENSNVVSECKTKKVSFLSKIPKLALVEKSISAENCRCHTIFADRQEDNRILKPMDRYVSTNRSFRLRMKHMNDSRSDDASPNPFRRTKSEKRFPRKQHESA